MQDRIVICEDDENVGALMALHLEGAGWMTVRVDSGVEALAEVRREPPALLLLDVWSRRPDTSAR
jgi:DNA-binding response OmpR family regulator